jgi:hypothetical protein
MILWISKNNEEEKDLAVDRAHRFKLLAKGLQRKYSFTRYLVRAVSAFIIICSAHVHWFVLQLKLISI